MKPDLLNLGSEKIHMMPTNWSFARDTMRAERKRSRESGQ